MSSAICFYLDQSKILSSGNEFRHLTVSYEKMSRIYKKHSSNIL